MLFAADVADPATLASWAAAGREAMDGYGEVHVVTRGHLPAEPVDGVMADMRSEAHHRYGVRRPSLYLVRPDKYVAHRGDSIDPAPVRDCFRAAGGPVARGPSGEAPGHPDRAGAPTCPFVRTGPGRGPRGPRRNTLGNDSSDAEYRPGPSRCTGCWTVR
ncbi:hypothetical protein A6A08_14735 [Nocardiopsis sp. TSRI0078]|nr:hypothetical protein A6A08_14735 [Nocardiopsis sp. TSRI0078]